MEHGFEIMCVIVAVWLVTVLVITLIRLGRMVKSVSKPREKSDAGLECRVSALETMGDSMVGKLSLELYEENRMLRQVLSQKDSTIRSLKGQLSAKDEKYERAVKLKIGDKKKEDDGDV